MSESAYPAHSVLRKVGSSGNFGYQGKLIQIGSRWAGARIRVIPTGALVHVYYGERLLRSLTIDPDRYYQPLNGRSPTNQTSTQSVR